MSIWKLRDAALYFCVVQRANHIAHTANFVISLHYVNFFFS